MDDYKYNKETMTVEVTGSLSDLLSAKDSYDHYFTSCRESHNGINSKDTVRYRALLQELRNRSEPVSDWFEENP